MDGLKQLLKDEGFEETSVSEVQSEYEAHSNLVCEFLQECYIIDTNDRTGEFCVQTEQVKSEWINWLRMGDRERRKYLIREGLEDDNSNSNDKDIDMDNTMIKEIAIQLLGRVLIHNKIVKKPIQINKEREYYYIGLKSRPLHNQQQIERLKQEAVKRKKEESFDS